MSFDTLKERILQQENEWLKKKLAYLEYRLGIEKGIFPVEEGSLINIELTNPDSEHIEIPTLKNQKLDSIKFVRSASASIKVDEQFRLAILGWSRSSLADEYRASFYHNNWTRIKRSDQIEILYQLFQKLFDEMANHLSTMEDVEVVKR